MQTMSWIDFYESFLRTKHSTPSYRLGQHFINMFIEDENSDDITEGLWEKSGDEAHIQCFQIIEKYQWDVQALPLKNKK